MVKQPRNSTTPRPTFWSSRFWQTTRTVLQKRSVLWPRVSELTASGRTFVSGDALLTEWGIALAAPAKIERENCLKELWEKHERLALHYPENWAMEFETLRLLYGLVRADNPCSVVETGIADGHSTLVLLSALGANAGDASLFSTDISPQSGTLVEQSSLLARYPGLTWNKVVLPAHPPAFEALLNQAGLIDIFIHDSDYSYPWQMMEYQAAWSHLRPGGWLCSDDIDASYAFLQFCQMVAQPPAHLFDRRKFFGVVRKPMSN